MRRSRLVTGIASCLVLSACGARRDERPSAEPRPSSPDVRACRAPGGERLPGDSAAVRCAEWFVARNGYTLAAPADTGDLALESIEWAGSWRELLAARRNTLAPRAVVVCRGARGGPGYTVAFAAPGDTVLRAGRAVTMDTTLRSLRVEHQDFLLTWARAQPSCAALAADARPPG